MDCQQTRDWLLEGDEPRPEAVADHLTGCVACQSFAADAAQLHDAWRSIPLPANVDTSRQQFLDRLARPTLPLARPASRFRALPRWVAAAVLLLGIGLSAWLLGPTPEAHAQPPVIERLVDWNLEMAKAPAAERGPLAARQSEFRDEVSRTDLPPADRELADMLLANGTWLAANDNPVEAAERFGTVADKMVEQMQSASDRKDTPTVNRYARLQTQVVEHGVTGNLKKAEESGALNFENPGRLEKMILRDEQRKADLVALLEKNPNLSRKDIRKALDVHPKHPKHNSGAKHKPAATNPNGGPTQP